MLARLLLVLLALATLSACRGDEPAAPVETDGAPTVSREVEDSQSLDGTAAMLNAGVMGLPLMSGMESIDEWVGRIDDADVPGGAALIESLQALRAELAGPLRRDQMRTQLQTLSELTAGTIASAPPESTTSLQVLADALATAARALSDADAPPVVAAP